MIFLDESGTQDELTVLAMAVMDMPVYGEVCRKLTKKKITPPDLSKIFEKTTGEFKFSSFIESIKKEGNCRAENFLLKKLEELATLNMTVFYMLYPNIGGEWRKELKERYCHLFLESYFVVNRDRNWPSHRVIADKQFFYMAPAQIIVGTAHDRPRAVITHTDARAHLSVKNPSVSEIELINSRDNKGLQLVDLVCGAIRHKYVLGDPIYYNKIKPILVACLDFRKEPLRVPPPRDITLNLPTMREMGILRLYREIYYK